MIQRTLRGVSSWVGKHRHRHTHPFVRDSVIFDYSRIDPSAQIGKSFLYGRLTAGKECLLDQCHTTGEAEVVIGDRSIFSGPINIAAQLNTVSFGKYCSVAPYVSIWEAQHHLNHVSTYFILNRVFEEPYHNDLESKGAVRIGNDVWIGTRAIILPGVTIGDGAVIGAGSVVAKDVPPYAIVAGVPAVLVRYRFDKTIREHLLELKWWDWDDARIRRNRQFFTTPPTLESFGRIC